MMATDNVQPFLVYVIAYRYSISTPAIIFAEHKHFIINPVPAAIDYFFFIFPMILIRPFFFHIEWSDKYKITYTNYALYNLFIFIRHISRLRSIILEKR